MGQIIIPFAVVRRQGYIYYIDGEGNIVEAESHQLKVKNEKEKKAAKEKNK